MNKNSKIIVAVVVVIVLIIASAAAYDILSHKKTAVTPPPPPAPKPPSTIIVDAQTSPGDLDPGVASTTPDWGVIQQIYQTLVAYNGSSVTSYVGQLAYKWTHGPNYFNWTFYLRQNVTFSNGDPFNAYVEWYSIYRSMLMNQSESFILWQNFNDTSIGPSFLNSANFTSPTPSELAVMENTSLPIYVVNKYEIHFTVGSGYLGDSPYAYFLATMTTPVTAAVDPIYIDQHGGVVADQKNTWMVDHTMGTGFYVLQNWVPGSYIQLVKNPDYWAASLPASELNNALSPARSNVTIDFVAVAATAITNLESGTANILSFQFSPTAVSSLMSVKGITVQQLPAIYGSTQATWYVYMNTSAQYFSNEDVRAAIVHAINYTEIIQTAFGGYASEWVGPVPAGFPDYNPSNLSPYQYNLTLAKQEMSAAGYPNGLPGSFQFLYVQSTDLTSAADIIASNLKQIGINITLAGVSLTAYDGITYPGGNVSQYPLGLEYYSADYVSPDDYTQEIVVPGGSSWPPSDWNNATAYNLTYEAAATTNQTLALQLYANLTELMYYNYIDAWLAIPYTFAIYSSNLQGVVLNPMGSAAPNFVMYYNTEYLT
ncbi:MAG: ABC transporter substrate-binding protein [Thermoplasmata archaeon]|uniref:ABC transporter substrate-binding protein n=1 Tax=Candidatus Sysuiplasma superficiale TaxID=2823368 RepID=A0A8J7YR86_9ARCH|nr:ABC transporter substrate-binding protein [Candidatus Sysuiplasma superficiale]MBX8643124.1 ABC transporter substrate-binding protein [Candidatus Sysuiplasma superficiale]MCL4346943.1 ABC transporter substrate-binding protein [Candidatus Thermoplasmatota archaeon]